MALVDVVITGAIEKVLRALKNAEISQERIEASELWTDGTVSYWLAVDRHEEIMIRNQGIRTVREGN